MEPLSNNEPGAGLSGEQKGRISRRGFIAGVMALAAGIGGIIGAVALQPTFAALVDTIIPEDEFGPAASETGAADVLWSSLNRRASVQIRARLVFAELNFKAGGSFASAGADQREAVLAEIFRRPSDDRTRRLCEWVRFRCMRHYYGNAVRARELGLVGAPQPSGHPDAALPWGGRS